MNAPEPNSSFNYVGVTRENWRQGDSSIIWELDVERERLRGLRDPSLSKSFNMRYISIFFKRTQVSYDEGVVDPGFLDLCAGSIGDSFLGLLHYCHYLITAVDSLLTFHCLLHDFLLKDIVTINSNNAREDSW